LNKNALNRENPRAYSYSLKKKKKKLAKKLKMFSATLNCTEIL
jgi:hypothetical protein